MRIVQIAHGFPPRGNGGTERYVERITHGLRNRGHTLFVYAGSPDWSKSFRAESTVRDGIELTRVSRNDLFFDHWEKVYNPLVSEHFQEYLTLRRPDLIHLHQWIRLSSDLVRQAAALRIPSVVTLHDFFALCPRCFHLRSDGSVCDRAVSVEGCRDCADQWPFQDDEEIAHALKAFRTAALSELVQANRVLSPSSWHAARLTRLWGGASPAITVLPLCRLTKLSPAPASSAKDRFRIVFFSHLYPHKGPDLLVQAFNRCTRSEEAELHLFGAEPIPAFVGRLREMARGKRVVFHGPYAPEDLQGFAMDLVVIPTLVPETYSLILDEASDLGVPVAVSEVGALPDRCRGRARLFRRGDVADLARVLDEAIRQGPALDRQGPPPPVSLEEHLDRVEAIYGEALAEKARPSEKEPLLHLVKDQWMRREYGLKALLRIEGWEGLVSSLRGRIAELERAASDQVKRPFNTP